ncbi:hypothetical protein JCM9957A_50310 [Kineosporia succinea]|uniref:Uncharacterized protein n=1 Tax=Kineosporia succinea TaxID=84632 RepID=A0ABT9P9K0_9ACTN|nr:hypothetical protein [Kineosporia succinea]
MVELHGGLADGLCCGGIPWGWPCVWITVDRGVALALLDAQRWPGMLVTDPEVQWTMYVPQRRGVWRALGERSPWR